MKATLEALKTMQSPRQIAARRGKKVSEVVAQREISRPSGEMSGETATAEDKA